MVGFVLGRVGEGDVVHPEDDLGPRLHALQGARRGEGEGHRLVGQLEVGLLLRVLLDELGQGLSLLALEGLQLPVLEVDYIGVLVLGW